MSDMFDGIKKLEQQQKSEINKIKSTKVRSNVETYVRKTFTVTDVHFRALELMKAHEGIHIQPNVREALDKHIPEKYIEMAKEALNK